MSQLILDIHNNHVHADDDKKNLTPQNSMVLICDNKDNLVDKDNKNDDDDCIKKQPQEERKQDEPMIFNKMNLFITEGDETNVKENGKKVEDDEKKTEKNVNFKSAIATLTTSCVEYSFGTFFNWFMPSCMDVWSLDDYCSSYKTIPETIIAYGARSFLFLLKVTGNVPQDISVKNEMTASYYNQHNPPSFHHYSIKYHDLINVFNHSMNKMFVDVFRTNNTYITTVVFEKQTSTFSRSSSNIQNIHKQLERQQKSINNNNFFDLHHDGPRIFVGNSDGSVALYNVQQRISTLQDLPFNSFKLPCCRKVVHFKILSATWLHFRHIGPVVFYSLDTHLIRYDAHYL